LNVSLAAVQTGIRDLRSNPLLTLVQGDALKHLEGMETDIKGQIAARAADRSELAGIRTATRDAAAETARTGDSAMRMVASNERLEALGLDQRSLLRAIAARRRTDFQRTVKLVGTSDIGATLARAIAKPDKDILPLVRSLVSSLTTGATPWARSLKNQETKLGQLQALERSFRATGDTRTANAIRISGRDVARSQSRYTSRSTIGGRPIYDP
jgi:hypothetical protein